MIGPWTREGVVLVLLVVCVGWVLPQSEPEITATTVVTLYVDQQSDVTLTTASCTDDDGDTVTLSGDISPTTLCTYCFVVEPTGAGGNYEINFYPSVANLNFNIVPEYTISLSCTDGENVTRQDLEVRLIPNSPPSFDDGNSVSDTFSNVKNIVAGTSLRQVRAADPNNDPIYFTMTSTPESDNFKIGISDGIIKAVNDLNVECNTEITFSVLISDGKISNVGPQVITVTLDNANVRPTIGNLDASGNLNENSPVGTSIFTIDLDDDGASTSLILTVRPATSSASFTLVGSQIQVAGDLDYEDFTERTSSLLIVADDGACVSQTYTYTLSLNDVNEAPIIKLNENPQEAYEGDVVHDPDWGTTDEDFDDTLAYTILATTPSTAPFDIDPDTGVITSTTNYDIDQNANTATVTLTIQVADSGGLTDRVELVLHLKDTNDHNPEFTAGAQDLVFSVTDCTAKGTVLGTFAATDDDSDFQGNNVLEFYTTATTTGSTANTIGGITISPSGDVILNSVLTAGTSLTVDVGVRDHGEHPGVLTSLVDGTVTVSSTACPTTTAVTNAVTTVTTTTTTTTTTLAPNTSDGGTEGAWWIAVAGILAAVFLALTMFLCLTRVPLFCKYVSPTHWTQQPLCRCSGQMCKRRKPPPRQTKVQMVDPVYAEPPRNPPLTGKGEFWKERFHDDNYREVPDRQALPEPADYNAAREPDDGPIVPARREGAVSPLAITNGETANQNAGTARVWATNVNNHNPHYSDGIL